MTSLPGTRQDDLHLVSRCLAWDPEAWNAFVATHAGFVQAESRRQLLRYRGRADAGDVDDACQEVFSLLMKDAGRTLRQFRGDSSLSTWLAYVVRSVCRQIAAHSDEAVRSPIEISYTPPTEEDLPPDGLEKALSRLSLRDQKLLRLFFFEGKKYRQIAVELGVSVNSVGPLLSRATQAVRRLLAR